MRVEWCTLSSVHLGLPHRDPGWHSNLLEGGKGFGAAPDAARQVGTGLRLARVPLGGSDKTT